MRLVALALVAAVALAGCTATVQSTDGAAAVTVRASFDDRSTYYTGDEVVFTAQATPGAIVTWDFGDGTGGTGSTVTHTYNVAGIYTVTVRAEVDGIAAGDRLSVTIRDLYGGTPQPVEPSEPAEPVEPGQPVAPAPVVSPAPSAYNVTLPNGEPTAGEAVLLQLEGPSEPGRWTIWAGEQVYSLDFNGAPAMLEVPTESAGAQQWGWLVETDEDHYGMLEFDIWGVPIEWSEPTSEQWLRPGAQTIFDGAQCTVNFLYHYKWYRFFIGSAAHCIDDVDINDVCGSKPSVELGRQPVVESFGGDSVRTKIAYSSWLTMHEKGGGSCPANDFALYELGPEAQKHMHPKAYFFGGPTALAEDGYATGTTLYGFGATGLRGNQGIAYPGQDVVNAKRGASLGVNGFYQQVYYATPGISGDSGGPAFGPGGEALGAASVIYTYPAAGSNGYTIISKALDYMEKKEGWAPDLVTYDDFSGLGA